MSDVWVGLTEVTKDEGCELEFNGVGAFVWWAAQADSAEIFLRKLGRALGFYGLVLIEVTTIRRFDETKETSGEIYEMAQLVKKDANCTLFGTFRTYRHHDA